MKHPLSFDHIHKKTLVQRVRHFSYPRWLTAALAPVLSYYLMELITHNPLEIPIQFQLLGWIFSYLLSGLLFFLSGRMNVALVLPQIFMAILGTANYFVLSFRESPILPWDIASAGTALSVADHFSFSFTPRLTAILLAYILLILFCLKIRIRLAGGWRKRLIGTGAAAAMSALYVLCLQNDALMNALNIYEMPFTQDYAYEQNGFFVSFLVNTKYLKVHEPSGYSPETADELLEQASSEHTASRSAQNFSGSLNQSSPSGYTGGGIYFPEDPVSSDEKSVDENQGHPNIIVIMNEAFSDLSVIEDFQVSEDYMPFFRSLYGTENTISGSVYVSVLGGNTANTEFEFLTGDTMAFLPTGSIPYQQFISGELPALPSILQSYGYQTIALHPYLSSGWRRNQVYPLLGFESSLFSSDFLYKERLRDYVTDDSAFKQIIQEYETKEKDSPFFSFTVTMQNHGGYAQDWEDFERNITAEGTEDSDLSRINAYLSLIKKTDDAFKDLISYFENCSEETIILMFGDHQPNVETSFLENLYGKSYEEMTEEELALRYQTPFILWANYDIEEEEGLEISVNYLSSLLMDAAGLEKTAYQKYLSVLQKELPVITANFCIDKDGNFYSAGEFDRLDELLNGYEIIQYNHLFDSKNRNNSSYLPD
ncbi:LTA synthase family protein [Qiania dongpingensis]|uniref:LTA synthase family protein n=1 Tax=Qiania dongpingensis TaxID=2763669 RepID=A0A7G9G0N4_9FIRM|nr:LTA synthase family protein [Qiania dongpingensis]QNM04366.1 LTA synthase family protein [Qiania dongpingensis]